jgi:hypothetical protein
MALAELTETTAADHNSQKCEDNFCHPLFQRGAMLARCVNPTCYAPLHSFCEGRLFQFEVVSISVAAVDDKFDEQPDRQTAHFWLCGRCANEMTLLLEPRRGLRLVPTSEDKAQDTTIAEFSLPEEEFRENC